MLSIRRWAADWAYFSCVIGPLPFLCTEYKQSAAIGKQRGIPRGLHALIAFLLLMVARCIILWQQVCARVLFTLLEIAPGPSLFIHTQGLKLAPVEFVKCLFICLKLSCPFKTYLLKFLQKVCNTK